MSIRGSAQLIDAAAACTQCGKEHKPRQISPTQQTWAAEDGHSYRSQLYEMTGNHRHGVIEALRKLAGQPV